MLRLHELESKRKLVHVLHIRRGSPRRSDPVTNQGRDGVPHSSVDGLADVPSALDHVLLSSGQL